jgi:ferredoxin
MEDTNKLPNNVPGKYYTTEECDGCAYCAAVAPDNFEFDKPTNTYFIGKQPVDREEEELIMEAKEDCPVDAIKGVTESDEPLEEAGNGSLRNR